MSLLRRDIGSVEQLLGERLGRRTGRSHRVSREQALRHSAVWACLRLRADLISTMPVDIFRRLNGIQVEQTKPPLFITPGGSKVGWVEWAYSTQVDLDSVGNTVGVITARDGLGLPSVIELANIDEVTFKGKGSKLTKVRIGKDEYDPEQIWHEKQYTLAGVPVGLSPIAHAAMSIRGYLSAQEFAADWFDNSTVPGGHLKNTARTLNRKQSLKAKQSFKDAVTAGDVWVSGSDWEYNMLSAKASESAFIESQQFSIGDACRFMGVPGDMIDAPVSGSSVTYANITQRNLQLLIINIGPAIVRREDAWSRGLVSEPRYVKLNPGALLRMDLKARYDSYKVGIDAGFLDDDEAREYENLPPLNLPNDKRVLKAADALGALVRAGFDPGGATAALGLAPIKHTGLVPITVAFPEQKDQGEGGHSARTEEDT